MGVPIQQRYILVLMVFLAVMVGLAQRTILPMAITGMVHAPHKNNDEKPPAESYCIAPEWASNQTSPASGEETTNIKYDWSQKQQGMILSSFYVGYILSHIPGGLLAQRFGGKYILGFGIFFSAILSLVTPAAVRFGQANSLIVTQIAMGFVQGPMFPAFAVLLSAWVPAVERAFLGAVAWSGMTFGSVVGSYLTGFIMHNYSWEKVFYSFGSVGVLWFIFFVFLCHSNPATHPYISLAERNYLLQEIGQLEGDEKQATPWRHIFTSKPVWTLIAVWICADWSYFVVSTTLPKYMNDVLHFNIRDIGIFNSVKWFLKEMISYTFGYAIDWCIANGKISISRARKLAIILASVFPAIFTMLASYAGCNHIQVAIFIILSVGMRAFLTSSLYINPMDLSSNYSGTLMSIVNGAGSIAGIIAPYSVGLLTPNAYLSEWRLVFWISCCALIMEAVIFTIWGSAEIQPWDNPNTEENENNKSSSITVKEKELI